MSDERHVRKARYSLAIFLLLLVPGLLVAILNHLRVTIMPRDMIESLFPWTILPVEKYIILKLYKQFSTVEKSPIETSIFDRIDLFGQQAIVVACLVFLLCVVIVCMQIRKHALYVAPAFSSQIIAVPLAILIRLITLYFFAAKADGIGSNLPSRMVGYYVMSAIAPEGLALFTGLIATSVVMAAWIALRTLFRRSR